MSKEEVSMDCSQFQLLLSAYVDDQLAPEEVWILHAHLKVCPPCTLYLADLTATVHTLRALPRPVPLADPWGAIAYSLRHEGLVRPWWQRPRPLGLGASAAAVLIAVYAYSALRPQPPAADLDAYWREHAIFTSQEEPANSAPALDAIEATYQMQGSDQ